jgi:hypothetical protein
MHLLSHMALARTATSAPLRKISGVTSSTSGDKTTIAHGLVNEGGQGQVPVVVLFAPSSAPDANGALTEPARVYEVPALRTATNIVVRGTAASVAFDAYVG